MLQKQAEDPGWFGAVRLAAPWLTFERALTIDLGGLTIALHHLPGHTEDCCLAIVPQRGLLLAGDCAEDPLPLVGNPARVEAWAQGLRGWAGAPGVRRVVPAHGAVGDAGLLSANAAYLEGLLAGQTAPPGAGLPEFYRRSHADNVALVVSGGLP